MIDTHAHLDTCGDDPALVVERARAAGVDRIVTVGSGLESCRESLAIAEQHEGVYCALGIHPHLAAQAAPADTDELRRLLEHPLAVAVGEAGLDFYRDGAPPEQQRAVFRAQVDLARELEKPLVVHTREADEATLELLGEHAGGVTVILHCMSSERLAVAARDRGYYGSFAGNVTYPRAGELRAAAAIVPSDRLLAETDSPYLAPQPLRGKPNEPAAVAHVYEALAAAREEPLEDCTARVDANAARVFTL